MANLNDIYDADNRAAAFENHKNGTLVSLAGPGTGKTYSLLNRIDTLTQQEVPIDSICYLTFIREISNAFIADYIKKFGAESYKANHPRISTLHGFACRLLRNQGFRIGYGGELTFLNVADKDDDSAEVFHRDLLPFVAPQNVKTVPQLKGELKKFKRAWQNCVDPNLLPDPLPKILSASLRLLCAYRLMDWDQTVPLADNLLASMEERPNWISKIRHFLVDEYQDFNPAEQQFITAVAANAVSQVIVGDGDQSLYSGRGGSSEALIKLYESEKCDQVSLVRCRRCKSRIVTAANSFLSSMRADHRPMLPLKDGGEVLCFYFKSTKAEVVYLSQFLSQCVNQLPETPKQEDGIVCLFPNRKVLDFYFAQLSPHIGCMKRKSAVHPLRLRLQQALKLIYHPGQRYLQRVILEQYSEIKPRHKKEMVNLILQKDISPPDALNLLLQNGALTETAASQASDFCEFCNALASQDAARIATQLAGHLGIDFDHLRPRLETFLQNLDESDEEEAIENLCDELIPDSAQPAEDLRNVLFLTMHGSKGLTKKTVVMPGLEKAWLPGDAKGDDLKERERLFYVALTRATDLVLITHPQRRARGDPLNYNAPGRGEICPFVARSGVKAFYQA